MKIIDNDVGKFDVKRIKSFRAMLDDNVNEEPHISQKKRIQGSIGFLHNSDPICLNPCDKLFIVLPFTSDFTEYSIHLI